jgi:hypothetical protein
LVDGFEVAKRATLEFLEKFKTPVVIGDEPDRDMLKMIARTTLRTKVVKLCLILHSVRNLLVYIFPPPKFDMK